MIIIGLVVYISDPGPIFFPHVRIGQNGKLFKCYKFRTMVVGANTKLREYLAANPEAKKRMGREL